MNNPSGDKLGSLRDMVISLSDNITERAKLDLYEQADIKTIKFILFEICAKLGSDFERFEAHYKAVHNRCMAVRLSEIERDYSQTFAGEMDAREISEVDTDEPLPLLFPE